MVWLTLTHAVTSGSQAVTEMCCVVSWSVALVCAQEWMVVQEGSDDACAVTASPLGMQDQELTDEALPGRLPGQERP